MIKRIMGASVLALAGLLGANDKEESSFETKPSKRNKPKEVKRTKGKRTRSLKTRAKRAKAKQKAKRRG